MLKIDPGTIVTLGREIFENLAAIQCRLANIAELPANSFDQNPVIGSGASPKRFREFAAGRAMAAGMLEAFGYRDVTIGIDKDRCPVWPDDMVGSISHSDTMIAVAISSLDSHLGIGIDIEPSGAVSDELTSSILTDRELAEVSAVDNVDIATLIFVCKEAFYKAVYPSQREPLDFHDVHVSLEGNSFKVECSPRFQSSLLAERGKGSVEYCGNHVVAVFRIVSTGQPRAKT